MLTKTKILIIQDEHELTKKKIGLNSVCILKENLSNLDVIMKRTLKKQDIEGLEGYTALLYPSTSSSVLKCNVIERETDESSSNIKTLIILDSSWSGVQNLLATRPYLIKLPHVRLPNLDVLSLYEASGLRKEPNTSFFSTCEAVAFAIDILEPTSSHVTQTLLEQFSNFIISKKKDSLLEARGREEEEVEEESMDGEGEEGNEDEEEVQEEKEEGKEDMDLIKEKKPSVDNIFLLPSRGKKIKKKKSNLEKRREKRKKEKRRS